MTPARKTYHPSIVILHWLMAAALAGMLASGLTYENLPPEMRGTVMSIHKATGLLLLGAAAARLILRIAMSAPPLPGAIPPLERKASFAGHAGLYALMIGIPTAGWVLVSASARSPSTSIYGLFSWPDIPGLSGNDALLEAAGEAHEIMAFALIALIIGHIGAVIWHAKRHRLNILPRIWFS